MRRSLFPHFFMRLEERALGAGKGDSAWRSMLDSWMSPEEPGWPRPQARTRPRGGPTRWERASERADYSGLGARPRRCDPNGKAGSSENSRLASPHPGPALPQFPRGNDRVFKGEACFLWVQSLGGSQVSISKGNVGKGSIQPAF